MTTAIDVSVIIPAWKAAGFIERAVSSALASAGVSVEVIVVDDASPDGTMDVLRRLAAADRRVIAERLPVNSGPSAARNRAIELARGAFVAVLDADDTMKPDRLAKLVALAKGEDIVADNMLEVDEAGRTLGPFLKAPGFAKARGIDFATWVTFNQPMKSADCLGYLKPLFRTAKLRELDLRYDPALRNSEDYYLVAHLLAEGARMTYTADPGYLYQRSPSSTSHRLKPEQTRAWLDAEKRFTDRYAGRLTQAERAALGRRGRGLREVNQLVAAMDAINGKRIGSFLGLLASDMRASVFTLGFLAKVAVGKTLPRKPA